MHTREESPGTVSGSNPMYAMAASRRWKGYGGSTGKRWAFRLPRNVVKVEADLSVGGNEFQTVGAAKAKERLPLADLMNGMWSRFCDDERKERVGILRWRKSERYDGWPDWSVLKVSVAILKVMRWRIGSQCSFWRAGVTWSNRFTNGMTILAREFWIRCKRLMDESGRLKNKELQ